MKRILFLLRGLFLTVIVFIAVVIWLLQTSSGAKALLDFIDSFDQVSIQYTDLKGNISSLTLSDLEFVSDTIDIQAGHLAIQWHPITALLKNNIQIEDLKANKVFINPKNTESTPTTTSVNKDWRLAFDLYIKSATLDDLHLANLHKDAIKHLSLSAALDKEQWIIDGLILEHPELKAELSGHFIPFESFSHSLQIHFDSPHSGNGKITADGNSESSLLSISIPKQKAKLNATLIDWLEAPSAEFSLDIDSPDLAGVSAKFSATGRGTLNEGTIFLNGLIDNQAIKLNTLNYQQTDGEFSIESKGVFSGGPFAFTADFSKEILHNSELTWAPKLGINNLNIKSLTTRMNGAWQALKLTSTAQGTLEKQAAILDLAIQLIDFKRLNIASSKLSILGGQINLSGSALVQAPFNVKLVGQAKGIHLEKLNAKLPELNNGVLDIHWLQENKKSVLSATLSDLRANVKNNTVLGSGQLRMTDNIIDQASLTLNAGKANRIKLDLIDQSKQTILLNADINDLGMFIDQASGSLSGKLQIDVKSVLLDSQLIASNFRIPELMDISHLSIDADHSDKLQRIKLNGRDLQFKEHTIKEAFLSVTGKPEHHQFDAQFTDSKARSLHLSGQGLWENHSYQFNLEQLRSNSPELGVLNNQAPLELFYSENNIVLKPFCLDSEIAQLCGEIQKNDSITGQFDLSLAATENIRPIRQQIGTVKLTPGSDTKIRAIFQIDNDEFSKLDVNAALGKLAIHNQEDESLNIDNVSMIAKREHERIALSINADMAGGKLDLQGYLDGPISDPSIEAIFKGNLPDLEEISPLLIATDIREGDLEIEMQLSGKTKAPRMSGFAKINNTKVIIPELGTTQQINADFTIRDSQNGMINGTLISGEGKGTIKGNMQWEQEPIVGVSLEGTNLLIADTDTLSLNASPTLSLNYAPGKLDISGTINIERAFSTLTVSGSNTSLSDDVIYIDDDSVSAKSKTQQLRNIDITTEFINPARIDGYGVTGAVTGKLRISQKDSGPVLGNGQLKITGQYKVFGQILQIESGRLNYVNTTLDNPSVEFYASRQVADVKVGVRVTGRPNALLSRLESTPDMREADILNYLVLGKAPGTASEAESNQLTQAAIALALARSESGIQTVAGKAGLSELSLTQEVGGLALSLGKQLSPRLYIAYTMGFVEPINIAKVRYMLSSKWILESQISEETRALIKYRFEKD